MKDSGIARHGRVPRIARLMAVAIKFQDMIDRGEITQRLKSDHQTKRR